MNDNTFTSKDQALSHLRSNYHKIGSPIFGSGISKLQHYYGNILSASDIENALASSYTYTIFRQPKKPKYNPTFIYTLRQQLQLDLADIRSISKENNDFHYLFVAIDVFSRRVFCRLIRRKTAQQVLNAFKSILEECGDRPPVLTVHSDKGSEIKNKHFLKYCEGKKIRVIFPETSHHVCIILFLFFVKV